MPYRFMNEHAIGPLAFNSFNILDTTLHQATAKIHH